MTDREQNLDIERYLGESMLPVPRHLGRASVDSGVSAFPLGQTRGAPGTTKNAGHNTSLGFYDKTRDKLSNRSIHGQSSNGSSRCVTSQMSSRGQPLLRQSGQAQKRAFNEHHGRTSSQYLIQDINKMYKKKNLILQDFVKEVRKKPIGAHRSSCIAINSS